MFRWLSLHSSYACRHAGACCSSGWPIPLERARVAAIEAAITERRIDVPESWLLPVVNQPEDVAGLLAQSEGRCVFRQRPRAAGGPRLHCSIHSALGHAALPAACQHFPRVCLIDDRGVSVTLSHYCPTAAALLLSFDGPLAIVEGPDAVPGGVPEGFDARGAWPPLLTPGVLMDLDSYTRWEAHLVSWLGGARNPDGAWRPEEVVRLLETQARRLAAWRPDVGTLTAAIDALASDLPVATATPPDWAREATLRRQAIECLPAAHAWPDEIADLEAEWRRGLGTQWRGHARTINRLLAAHAFASWTAYRESGIRALITELSRTLAVLRHEAARVCRRDDAPLTAERLVEAIRQTDLLLVHLVDRESLAAEAGR